MAIHYNAFISYRHHPDDIRVASEIHRSLEHFKVPRSIKKKHGQIQRLFRDKEELPITSNLTDDIDEALKNSDWLIVICSVHTKESVWVQREIDLFLQTHPRNRVLTVLASGEPYDVIPEALLYKDVVDPVTGETVRNSVEPLSCDWRMKRKKAKQEELPRLAAAILGCGYDELRQRQKQYRARRNTAIISTALAASLSLAAYFLYTTITIQKANEEIKAANIQIKANLDESLINQSRHLATAAQERLDDGDRLTAIALAMAALPGDDNQRPYVPEAENVLISALGIYSRNAQPSAVGTVSPGMNIGIQNFWVTDSDAVIYVYDQRDHMTIWDTKTLQKLGEFSLGEYTLYKLITLPNDNALISTGLGGSSIRCYKPDGTLLWQRDDCRDMAYLPETDAVLVINEENLNDCELLRLDAATGNIVGEPVDLTLTDSDMTASSFGVDTQPLEDLAVIRYYTYSQTAYYCIDLRSGEKQLLPVVDAYPSQMAVTQDGKLLVLGTAEGTGFSGYFEGNRVNSQATKQIYCYDLRSSELLWQNEISTYIYGISTLSEIPGSGNILCQNSNKFMVLDPQTGEILSSCDAGNSILAVSVGEEYATAILQDGYTCNYWYESNYCYEAKCMKNDVSLAAVRESYYALHLGGDHITIYRSVVSEPDWRCDLGSSITPKNRKISGQYLAFEDYSYLYLFDTQSRTLCRKIERGQNQLLGFSADGTKLWYTEGKETLHTLDIATGNSTSASIPVAQADSGASIRGKFFLQGDCLYYVIGGMEKPELVSWNLNTQEEKRCTLTFETEEDIAYWSWEALAVAGDYLWLWGQERILLEVDMTSGNAQCLAEQTVRRPAFAVQDGGEKVAFTDQGCICLKIPGQAEITVIAPEQANAGSLYLHGDTLLALCDNGFVYRMDDSGNQLSQTKLQVASGFGNSLLSISTDLSAISWHFTADNKLIVNALGTGNVIACDTWTVGATVSDFLMYDESEGFLICRLTNAIGGYRVYETAQLLQMAGEALNGFVLTQEQKVSYGIE